MMTKTLIRNRSFIRMLLTGFIIFILSAGFSDKVNAQASGKQDEIFVVADEMPVFPGGQKALLEFIYSKVEYPSDAIEKGIEGKVILRFAINKEGKAIQPSISKGLYASIDEAVLDIVPKMPNFEPGKIGGKAVSVWYAVPINFKINK
jgi:periplasmic protein TonB